MTIGSKGLFEWFHDRRGRDGGLMLTRKDFTDVFPVDVPGELDALKEMCKAKGLIVTVDPEHTTFTFELADPG